MDKDLRGGGDRSRGEHKGEQRTGEAQEKAGGPRENPGATGGRKDSGRWAHSEFQAARDGATGK